MCGILTIVDLDGEVGPLRETALRLAKRLRHRGPDWSGIYSDDHAILAHERLSIVDVEHGAQPLIDKANGTVLSVNGEIYNHLALRGQLLGRHEFQTASDCEVILYLYNERGAEFLNALNGIYAFFLYDPAHRTFLIARDPIGVVPLYWGWDDDGRLFVASEMKAIVDTCKKVEEFPPGHFYLGHAKQLTRYYEPAWYGEGYLPRDPYDAERLRSGLEKAVRRQLMCDVPYGILVSGGLDSSVIAAIAAKYAKGRVEEEGRTPAWWPQLHTFSVGLADSPDLKMAAMVARHIGSIHHEIAFTVQEGLDALSDVIFHLETFDITTVRAATPMYLMSRKIRAMGIKMILSGEGADEVFGGYLYFHKAPSAEEFFRETVRKVRNLHLFDCLRANKATAAWGVEARVPFLDREFLDIAMAIDAREKMITGQRMEKWILRKTFEDLLPREIVWRQKEQFSDGVGYSWIDSLKCSAEALVSDRMMETAVHRFPQKTPLTKEGYWYRSLFESHFPSPAAVECVPDGPSIACSTPIAVQWDKEFGRCPDPSGRAVAGVHKGSRGSGEAP